MTADAQTLNDLEFPVILEDLSTYAAQPTARERLLALSPLANASAITVELQRTKEMLRIRAEGETVPAIDFEELTKEIQLLPIHNASISLEGFMRIKLASLLVNQLLVFFEKREKDYPLLCALMDETAFTKEIIEKIDKVFDRAGKVRDDASEKLTSIRSELRSLRIKINRNFEREMKRLQKDNVLGETAETYLNDRRVLTVLSQYKRKVSGSVHGSSNTGNFTYIEPAANIQLNNELELLLDDERKEIFRILQQLRIALNAHLDLIRSYQYVLTTFDFINGKARYALAINGDLPRISEEKELELIDAFHPILWKNNRLNSKPTFPQTVTMDKFSRVIVISGPNAGGKSITLKSVGLLQLMFQSGLLVPVHPNSTMCVFQRILSDIGDNQSIANELSTYSYRLKRMKHFLDQANRNSLILIDEFGTGSDPDLGGALAEAIFETLYNKKTFGILTTHYANIKLKANQLKNAVNGSMLFDTETLEPKYKFVIGQPGSSFTFEVATINGIPEEIIAAAKDKISEDKLKMDRLLSDLQKEKNYLSRLNAEHMEAQELAQEARNHFNELSKELEARLEKMRVGAAKNERLVQLGAKLSAFIDRYVTKSRKQSNNEPLMEDVRKFLAVEKNRIETAKEKAKQQEKKAIPMRKAGRKAKPENDPQQRHRIKVGSAVKLLSTKQSGTVEDVAGDQITVSFGFLRMKVSRDKLQWIADAKN